MKYIINLFSEFSLILLVISGFGMNDFFLIKDQPSYKMTLYLHEISNIILKYKILPKTI